MTAEELAREATPGPWYDANTVGDALEKADICTTPEVDAPFIAHCSPDAILALLEEVEEVEEFEKAAEAVVRVCLYGVSTNSRAGDAVGATPDERGQVLEALEGVLSHAQAKEDKS